LYAFKGKVFARLRDASRLSDSRSNRIMKISVLVSGISVSSKNICYSEAAKETVHGIRSGKCFKEGAKESG
jgi:hypothetical protein